MNEYVTHAELVEAIELLTHISLLDAFIAVMVYDLLRYGISCLVDYLDRRELK
ncbi:hypothetical protein [Vibrio jasicida]|uniref:hypothetical protein n=1 Tax=Vibrio jasicida TaxID=766224 RepID=UPI00039E0AFF|nr:hypothetical protein [Vibrio jasicida]